ncbi:hypothetical protein KMW28_06350 [Flammeovirga yaeyamensis]|uniref:Uncharacterized protein n=1 Tax=Flammeovirga yaeyamensis TaxID=367791 RepID=A0AAX1NB07_9BACT|nr:hypothetical protein [Flammeovirga yaeyamensis]MBB3697793.1 ribosomal protein L28 [Flammeovirga yaeyamensis]NMF35851.1 hypothetical protein [Flammeovirga yaeyamensis]QWG03198.1 hypothetical protein KMW28_06350 [Flammeovirga yaeyamensis]
MKTIYLTSFLFLAFFSVSHAQTKTKLDSSKHYRYIFTPNYSIFGNFNTSSNYQKTQKENFKNNLNTMELMYNYDNQKKHKVKVSGSANTMSNTPSSTPQIGIDADKTYTVGFSVEFNKKK